VILGFRSVGLIGTIGRPPPAFFLGAATGGATATVPAHRAGDLLIAWAYRASGTTAPSLPAGWTSIATQASGSNLATRLAYRVATASGTLSGTWTNADGLAILAYRRAHPTTPIGARTPTTGSSSTHTYDTVTLDADDASSLVIGFGASFTNTADLSVAPEGMTNRAVRAATGALGVHDSVTGVPAWASATAVVGGTSALYVTQVLEIIARP
jgi:hypothetical protein